MSLAYSCNLCGDFAKSMKDQYSILAVSAIPPSKANEWKKTEAIHVYVTTAEDIHFCNKCLSSILHRGAEDLYKLPANDKLP